jgi:hypothetical protein
MVNINEHGKTLRFHIHRARLGAEIFGPEVGPAAIPVVTFVGTGALDVVCRELHVRRIHAAEKGAIAPFSSSAWVRVILDWPVGANVQISKL